MQFEITDRAAIVFAGEFYAALADGYPVDSAVAEARKAIFADANDIEWGTPVLFMRVPDGRIFDVTRRAAPPEVAEEEPEQPPPAAAEPTPVAEAPAADEVADEPEPAQPEPEAAEELPVAAASAPAPAPPQPRDVAAPTSAAPGAVRPQRSRPLPVAILALTGAGIGFIANGFSHLEGEPAMGKLAILAPETIGVQVLVAAVAILLGLGRIREQIAHGLLLGFGLLTVAGAIGLALVPGQIGGQLGDAPLVLLAGGAVVLTAAILGILGDDRAHEVADARFRWVRASLLAAVGAAVGFIPLFVPFGRLLDGSAASVIGYGSYGFTGSALEPIVAIAAAIVVAYALGREGGRRPLAAGVAIALGAQTALYYGSWVGGVVDEYYLKPELGWGCVIGFAAAGLLLAAGLVGRRSLAEHAKRSGAVAAG